VSSKQSPAVVRVKYPISFKLVTIITLLLLLSLGAITTLVSIMVSSDVQLTAEDNNLTVNKRSADEADNFLDTIRSNVFLLLDMQNAADSSEDIADQTSAFFFSRNPDVAAIIVSENQEFVNHQFFESNEIIIDDFDNSPIAVFMQSEQDAVSRAAEGEAQLLNASPIFGIPLLAMLSPWQESGSALIILFSPEKLTESFGTGINSSFMINNNADYLIYSEDDLILAGANASEMPIVQFIQERPDSDILQMLTEDQNGIRFFSAFSRLSFPGAVVVTFIEYDNVFAQVAKTTRSNIFLTSAVLFAAIILTWFFSKTISVPIKLLAVAAEEIEQGQFDIQLKAKTKDELGLLTESFVHMGRGLAERERLKDTFGRFINKDIAEKAMKGELSLGGENKHVTVFFSDIRSFTAISEKLEPHEVVEFLNEYMTKMVKCVNDTQGVVDKFIGDAVMAIWGAPISGGSPAADALNCIRSALMMRAALLEFNQGRGGDKKPIIKIGCGINTGDVVAGQIGSNERMEYTVIGDAVNLASRTESLNKPLGTDILITENTYKLIGRALIVEEMPAVTVKGKEKPIRLFAVVNMHKPHAQNIPLTGDDGPKTLAELRTLMGIIPPDAKVDINEDEKKYSIQGS
jgi:adenylate cyclase